MCSLLYFFHMFICCPASDPDRGVALLHTVSRGLVRPCATRRYRRHSPTRPQIILCLHQTLRPAETRRVGAQVRRDIRFFSLVGWGKTPAVIVSAIFFLYICPDAPLSQRKRRRRRGWWFCSLLVKWRSVSLFRNAFFFPLLSPRTPTASHFSTWTAPGVVTRKREALKSGGRELVCNERHARRA